ncbi:hypothetical protein BJ912DRAFT_933834 [Pholiota molesta]|nr:hypothetical protein BJ912DRAFT_933834 [Pholiota molesta]
MGYDTPASFPFRVHTGPSTTIERDTRCRGHITDPRYRVGAVTGGGLDQDIHDLIPYNITAKNTILSCPTPKQPPAPGAFQGPTKEVHLATGTSAVHGSDEVAENARSQSTPDERGWQRKEKIGKVPRNETENNKDTHRAGRIEVPTKPSSAPRAQTEDGWTRIRQVGGAARDTRAYTEPHQSSNQPLGTSPHRANETTADGRAQVGLQKSAMWRRGGHVGGCGVQGADGGEKWCGGCYVSAPDGGGEAQAGGEHARMQWGVAEGNGPRAEGWWRSWGRVGPMAHHEA